MRSARLLCLLLALGLPAAAIAGDVQVTCEPGLSVYLDGQLVGTTSTAEDGLFLAGVSEGKHTLRVDKPGCLPQGFAVEVTKLPIQVKVQKFVPVLGGIHVDREPAKPDMSEVVGRLTITSAPQNCTVVIDGKPEPKNVPFLAVGSLLRGRHTIAFNRPGKDPISTVIDMEPGADITVRGDLLNGKVDVYYEGMGSLRVLSTPTICTVSILGSTREKRDPIMNMTHLPAGRHHMVVSWGGRELSTDVLISNRYRTVVTVNFGRDRTPFTFSYEPE